MSIHAGRESSASHDVLEWMGDRRQQGTYRPETPLQALMEAAPGQPTEESVVELQDRLEAVRAALESGVLDQRELWLIEAIHWRRLSYAQVGRELSLAKSYVHRMTRRAERKLGAYMRGETAVDMPLAVDEVPTCR